MSLRQLRVLVEALPPDSPLIRAVEGNAWGDSEWILHSIDSQMRALRADIANIMGAKPPVKPKFLPTPRDRASVEDAVVDEQVAIQQRSEMDAIAARIFDPE